jgi:hypothetical protein
VLIDRIAGTSESLCAAARKLRDAEKSPGRQTLPDTTIRCWQTQQAGPRRASID